MEKDSRPVYQKQNSFFEIRNKQASTVSEILDRIEGIRQRNDVIGKMSQSHQEIFSHVCRDLFEENLSDGSPQFSLSPNVIEEIATFSNSDLPRYLVHRYRYEIFPQQKVLDEYPPYLQIEPTSICNFRCVFCFETDPTFTDKSKGFMGQMELDLF